MSKQWKVVATNNQRGDLAIVPAGNVNAVNRLATVPVRRRAGSEWDANTMAAAPEMLAVLQQILQDDLLDTRERQAGGVKLTIRTLLERCGRPQPDPSRCPARASFEEYMQSEKRRITP